MGVAFFDAVVRAIGDRRGFAVPVLVRLASKALALSLLSLWRCFLQCCVVFYFVLFVCTHRMSRIFRSTSSLHVLLRWGKAAGLHKNIRGRVLCFFDDVFIPSGSDTCRSRLLMRKDIASFIFCLRSAFPHYAETSSALHGETTSPLYGETTSPLPAFGFAFGRVFCNY